MDNMKDWRVLTQNTYTCTLGYVILMHVLFSNQCVTFPMYLEIIRILVKKKIWKAILATGKLKK